VSCSPDTLLLTSIPFPARRTVRRPICCAVRRPNWSGFEGPSDSHLCTIPSDVCHVPPPDAVNVPRACTGVWPCVITVASTHRHRRCANLCRGKELQRLHLTQECCSVVVILLLTRKPHGKPTTRSHEHNTHPFPLQTGNGAACQSLTFTYISTAIQAADDQTILLLLEGLGRPVFL